MQKLVETGWVTGLNQSRPVLVETGLNRLAYSNRTDVNRLGTVRSSCVNLRVQSQPVAVAVAPDQGPKTGPNRTFKHYPPLPVPDDAIPLARRNSDCSTTYN